MPGKGTTGQAGLKNIVVLPTLTSTIYCTRIRRQHPDVLVNIQDSKIASELLVFLMNVPSSMELLSDFQISCAVSELI